MLRVSKLTDYATAVINCWPAAPDFAAGEPVLSAQDLAERAHLEAPTVSKLLKQLAHGQLVESFRGVNGGYRLARAPERISIADIVIAMEGPIGMTECSAQVGLCGHESHCGVRVNWQRINQAIAQALAGVTLADMVKPLPKRAAIALRLAEALMAIERKEIETALSRRYTAGFVTDIESDSLPPGLSEDVVRAISARKKEPEWMTDWRLSAYRHWLTMQSPQWAKLRIAPIDFQAISYFSQPKNRPKSLADVDPKLLETYDKLGVPLHERARLAGVAVDAVFDSVSVGTTFRKELAEAGVIFCAMSEAVREYPELVRKYLGSVVPTGDNYFAALNSAVFSDGSFVFVPKGVRCPMELSTYFRINARDTGQFERTLLIAEEGASVSYLEGCTAPMRDENQLHAAVVELVALDDADIKYSTVQNWYPGDENGRRRHLQFRHQAWRLPRHAAAFPGPRSKPARRSPGNIRAASCAATIPAASSTRSR